MMISGIPPQGGNYTSHTQPPYLQRPQPQAAYWNVSREANKPPSIFSKVKNYFKGLGMAIIGRIKQPKVKPSQMPAQYPIIKSEKAQSKEIDHDLAAWGNFGEENQSPHNTTTSPQNTNNPSNNDNNKPTIDNQYKALLDELKAKKAEEKVLFSIIRQQNLLNNPMQNYLANQERLTPDERSLF